MLGMTSLMTSWVTSFLNSKHFLHYCLHGCYVWRYWWGHWWRHGYCGSPIATIVYIIVYTVGAVAKEYCRTNILHLLTFLNKFHHFTDFLKSYTTTYYDVTETPSPRRCSDVTLMQTLQGKGRTCCGNSDNISHNIISCSGLEIFLYINLILTKLCC